MKRNFVQQSSAIQIEDFIGRFTLIVGDVYSGKTTLTRNIFDTYCRHKGGAISVVDLAPTFPPSNIADVKEKEEVEGMAFITGSAII